ncbi:MAG: site-specific DNA-methyltransferase, partial [Bdellovibrionales bacterium]|nr:site-specific DNA-methyltransferase [Bdellovibrionales bacterium]
MSIYLYNEDFLKGVDRLNKSSIDLVIADPPYSLGKDYGNDSDKKSPEEFLNWTKKWITAVEPKIKETGSLYIFTTWRFAPEIFSFIKKKFLMINEIIWDRKVPSMGGSTRRFSSVHDTIGIFAKSKNYYFDIDSV